MSHVPGPRSSSGASERPRKLKRTCDGCTVAKVKCDRGQPACSKCLQNGLECHYSESLRVGRPRHSSKSSPTGLPPAGISMNRQSFDFFPAMMLPQPLYMNSQADSQPWQCNVGTEHFAESMESTYYETPTSISGFDTAANLSLGYSTDPFDDGTRSTVSYLNDSSVPLSQHSPSGSSTGTCMKRASLVMESLFKSSSMCNGRDHDFEGSAATAGSSIEALDSTLQSNKFAMTTILDFVACPCSGNAYMIVILTILLQQAVDVFLSIVRKSSVHGTSYQVDTSLGAYNSESTNAESPPSSVYDVSLAVGGYVLTGDTRHRVINQVLQSELVEFDAVLSRLNTCSINEESLAQTRDVLNESIRARMKEAGELLAQGV